QPNVSLHGRGFEWLRIALKQGATTGAALECVWAPNTSSAYLRDHCHSPAWLVNDTLLTCGAPPSACMAGMGYKVEGMELRYGMEAALTSLVVPCASCVHVAIPEVRLEQETEAIPEEGGEVSVEVSDLETANVDVVCRFRHAASKLGPMFTKPALVPARLEDSHITCKAPDWNTSLEGGFGGDLTYRRDEAWWWLLDLALDGGNQWRPKEPLKVNVTRVFVTNLAPSELIVLPPSRNWSVEEPVNSTCLEPHRWARRRGKDLFGPLLWIENHGKRQCRADGGKQGFCPRALRKAVSVATGPLETAVEHFAPAMLPGDGTLVCNDSTGRGRGSTYDVHVDGLDLAVPVYDSRSLRLKGKSLWSEAWGEALTGATLTPIFSVVPSHIEASDLPEAVILVGYGFLGHLWLCRWAPMNIDAQQVTYMGQVVNDTALSCPVALEVRNASQVFARWEVQGTTSRADPSAPARVTLPMAVEVGPERVLLIAPEEELEEEPGPGCLEMEGELFRLGPCPGSSVACALSACRLLPLVATDEEAVAEGRRRALQDDMKNLAWMAAEVRNGEMCDPREALRWEA
ncbi:unnamed protein product, partial [Effrenium voratum]